MPFLKVFTNDEERTVFLGDEPIVFGRGEDVDVMLKDTKVSREHCVIEQDRQGQWRVLDLQSGNGTRVNGEPIQSHVLSPEDVVEVGDAKVLFAAEAVAVVQEVVAAAPPKPPKKPTEQPEAERPARTARTKKSSNGVYIFAGVAIAGLFVIALLWKSSSSTPADEGATSNGRSGAAATQTEEQPTGRSADAIIAALPRELDAYARVPALEDMLKTATDADRPGFAEALSRARDGERAARERFFGDLESIFAKQVEAGEFARAREIWFFLRGDPHWTPIPGTYTQRIIQSNMELENVASAARSRLLGEVVIAEDAHDFKHAEQLVREALVRFRGTAVERNLTERLAEIEHALTVGVKTPASKPKTSVRGDTRKRMTALMAQLSQRDFATVAAGLKELIAASDDAKEQIELEERAGEVQAAAALQAKLVAALATGKASKRQIANRWTVLGGDAKQLKVRSKGNEHAYPWNEVPPVLHLALLTRHVEELPTGALGLLVAAQSMGGDAEKNEAIATAFSVVDEKQRAALDNYIAEVVRNEPMPEGGYVMHEGALMSRAVYVRQQEEELIKGLQEQFNTAYAAIKADKSLKKLNKLIARKGELDAARAHALELIFDTKKYFYPYRHRAAEYYPVQKEVDHRVEAVRDIWDEPGVVKVAQSAAMVRLLKNFDEAAKELEKRFIDVEEKVWEVDFLRSYFGQKFNIQTLYRHPDERELLSYSVEVMESNTTVPGDIKDNEREQTAVTNRYRMMFGRQPVRVVEKLVDSSRGHCKEMSEIGYFGHFSPTPGRKTPYDRMRLSGYQYGASENIVAGTTDPKSSHQRWCHSSGHHRNLLMEPWTEMGTGAYGSMMCQNFGRAPKWRGSKPGEGGDSGKRRDSVSKRGDALDPDDDAENDSSDEPFDYGPDDE